MSTTQPEWFRRPKWAVDWEAWKKAAVEVADLTGEPLPWPYRPEPPSAFMNLLCLVEKMLKEREQPHESGSRA
jgi:hypothetical protein